MFPLLVSWMGLRPLGFLAATNQELKPSLVALGPEPADDCLGEVGEVGLVPEWFPAVNIADVYLDKRDRDGRQGIAHGD